MRSPCFSSVTATGGGDAAGIGTGFKGKDENITINGGNITATGGSYGAGIGGGYETGAGTITLNGGNITSTGQESGAGIGGGYQGTDGTITISGGNVTATANSGNWYKGSGIGAGSYGSNVSFSTGGNGNAVIHANSISDESKKDSWSGIIFEGISGTVYGNQTLSGNFEVKDGETLNIPNESSLTVTGAVTNKGTIEVWGVLEGDSKITNSGSGKIIYHYDPQVTAPTFDNAKYGYAF